MYERSQYLISSVTSDAMSLVLPVGSDTIGFLAGQAVEALYRRRHEQARDILIDELRKGDRRIEDAADVNEIVAIVHRYSRAAQEGAARLNLRLMAKVIAGQAHLGNLVADEFLYYADHLASLRREEVILIATLHRHRLALQAEGQTNPREADIWKRAVPELVSSVFQTEELMRATATATTRTGLTSVAGSTWDGEQYFTTTPLMDRLEGLAPFDEALKEEGIAAEADYPV